MRQSASVTSQALRSRAGRTLDWRALCFRSARTMDCGESSSFAKTLECHSRAAIFVKSARGALCELVDAVTRLKSD